MSSNEIRKRKITDFFNSQKDVEPLKRRTSANSPLVELKCPKQKIFDDSDFSSISTKENRRSLKIEKDHQKSQRVLDCGQSKIGNVLCEECGMVYCVDSPQDCHRHLLHHNRYSDTDSFKVKTPVLKILEQCAHKKVNLHHIFHVSSKSPSVLRKAVDDWMVIVNESIGYCGDGDHWSEGKRLFLCVSKDSDSELFTAGIIVIEKLTEATTEATKVIIKSDEDPNDWIVGVDRIWTHQSSRKIGIASSLLDAATMLDRTMEFRRRRLRVAFSELSNEGKEFARKFVTTRYLADEEFGKQLLFY